jgi:hypothetical protein
MKSAYHSASDKNQRERTSSGTLLEAGRLVEKLSGHSQNGGQNGRKMGLSERVLFTPQIRRFSGPIRGSLTTTEGAVSGTIRPS